MSGPRASWALGAALALVVHAGILAEGPQIREHDAEWMAPADAAGKSNPLEGRPDLEAGGRKVFRHRCAVCHGDAGQGTTRGPSLVSMDVRAQTDGALFWKISSGNTHQGMPAFSFLPEAQRWQLVLHLRALDGTPSPR